MVRVAPLQRMPVSMRFFDYELPSELAAIWHPGQLVEIPWRNKTTYGILLEASPVVSVEKIKSLMPHACIGVDVIVGAVTAVVGAVVGGAVTVVVTV